MVKQSQLGRILVTGAGGQLGSALAALLGGRGIALSRAELDLGDPASLAGAIERFRPGAVINAAAYTAVDKAEEEREAAFRVNAQAPGALARYCAARGIPFVHFSTDYVYDGGGSAARTEDAPTAPLNVYGQSKLAGERAVEEAGGNYLIFRTSWVYDASGKNFLSTMLRLGAERESLSVVADQHGAPTYAPHLAGAALRALEAAAGAPVFPSGIYHLCNRGETTWHGFAEAIFAAARKKGLALAVKEVKPIPAVSYPTPAKRPLNSRLSLDKFERVFGFSMPEWEEGLAEAMGVGVGNTGTLES